MVDEESIFVLIKSDLLIRHGFAAPPSPLGKALDCTIKVRDKSQFIVLFQKLLNCLYLRRVSNVFEGGVGETFFQKVPPQIPSYLVSQPSGSSVKGAGKVMPLPTASNAAIRFSSTLPVSSGEMFSIKLIFEGK